MYLQLIAFQYCNKYLIVCQMGELQLRTFQLMN